MHPPASLRGWKEKQGTPKIKNKKKNICSPNSSLKGRDMPPFRPSLGSKKKKEENPHKQSGRSENAGGDRGGLAKWFKTQLKF